ncbi:MAG: hypothetical protein V4560_09310 [Bacteroidota bacterium]
MEIDKNPQPVIIVTEPQELKLSDESIVYLQQSGKWARFLGITGIVTAILLFLFGIFFASMISIIYHHPTTWYRLLDLYGVYGYRVRRPPFAYSGFMVVIYTCISSFVFFVSYNLNQFGIDIQKSLANNDNVLLNTLLKRVKKFFKITGIIVMCSLVITIIAAIYLAVIVYTIQHTPGYPGYTGK